MFWESPAPASAPAAEGTPLKTPADAEAPSSTSSGAPEIAPEPTAASTPTPDFWGQTGGIFADIGDSITKGVEELDKQNQENLESMRQDWGRTVAKINADNLELGRKIFSSAEDGIEDMIIAQNIETMKAAAKEVQDFIMSAPISIRVQGFLAGIVVMVTALLSMIVSFLNANVLVGLIHLFFMIPALLFVVIEYKPMFIPSRINNFIREEVRFVFRPYGRPAILNLAACFIISQGDLDTMMGRETLLGGFIAFAMTMIGLVLTWQSQHQLEAIKYMHIDYSLLSKKFNAADSMMKGTLDTHEFVTFLDSIGMTMDFESLNTALLDLDENHDGEVSWEEFIAWYEHKDDYLV